MPEWARGLGEWLVVNPWRVLVPLAGVGYLLLRVTYGVAYRELILGLLGISMTHLKAMGAWAAYIWATTVAG